MRKEIVTDSTPKLPDESSKEDIIERLIIIEKIKKGRQHIKEGNVNTEDQARVKLDKWLR